MLEGESVMSTRTKIVVLVGVVLTVTGAVAALLIHDDVKPIGTLSRSDVHQIRAVVMRSQAPGWRWFTRANLRSWPFFVRMRLTFRIVDIREDSIGIVTIHPDGTREVRHSVIVRFRAQGWSGDTCRVERKNGRWVVAPVTFKSYSPLILFLPPNPVTSADAGFASLFHTGRAWFRAAEFYC